MQHYIFKLNAVFYVNLQVLDLEVNICKLSVAQNEQAQIGDKQENILKYFNHVQ